MVSYDSISLSSWCFTSKLFDSDISGPRSPRLKNGLNHPGREVPGRNDFGPK